MKAAALFPIGQTAGGCIAAIQHILKLEESLNVYLLHGMLAPGQSPPDPLDVAKQIANTCFSRPVSFQSPEPIDTFNLSDAYANARAAVSRIAVEHYHRVYVGITGGANPLVASVFHAAITYLSTEVVPIYAQGKGLQTERIFVAPDIRMAVLAEEAIATARSGQLRVAAQLAMRLPAAGEWSFAQAILAALAAWDNFDYSQARDTLRRQSRHCSTYQDHWLLSGLSETTTRLVTVADRMVEMTSQFRNVQNFEKLAATPDWPFKARADGGLLVADALANAKRRRSEGRYTDSVLRAYRAAECATQVRLFEIGIHPAKPAAFPSALAKLDRPVDVDKPLAFRTGLDLLNRLGKITYANIDHFVKDLCQTRNGTYLEHGYARISQNQAERCLNHALAICRHLLGEEMMAQWPDLDMRI